MAKLLYLEYPQFFFAWIRECSGSMFGNVRLCFYHRCVIARPRSQKLFPLHPKWIRLKLDHMIVEAIVTEKINLPFTQIKIQLDFFLFMSWYVTLLDMITKWSVHSMYNQRQFFNSTTYVYLLVSNFPLYSKRQH